MRVKGIHWVGVRAAMETKGAVFVGSIGRGGAWEWSYFRAPGGAVHQLLAKSNGR